MPSRRATQSVAPTVDRRVEPPRDRPRQVAPARLEDRPGRPTSPAAPAPRASARPGSPRRAPRSSPARPRPRGRPPRRRGPSPGCRATAARARSASTPAPPAPRRSAIIHPLGSPVDRPPRRLPAPQVRQADGKVRSAGSGRRRISGSRASILYALRSLLSALSDFAIGPVKLEGQSPPRQASRPPPEEFGEKSQPGPPTTDYPSGEIVASLIVATIIPDVLTPGPGLAAVVRTIAVGCGRAVFPGPGEVSRSYVPGPSPGTPAPRAPRRQPPSVPPQRRGPRPARGEGTPFDPSSLRGKGGRWRPPRGSLKTSDEAAHAPLGGFEARPSRSLARRADPPP